MRRNLCIRRTELPITMHLSSQWQQVLIAMLDIALVAIIIYELLSLIRGTRAAYMLIGVAAVGLAFYLAGLSDLHTLNWVLTTLLPYAVFALIVVFAG